MTPIIFDIETGPLDEVLAKPEEWFEADKRLKDQAKIKESFEEKVESATLSPITSKVLAVGYHFVNRSKLSIREPESHLIKEFFELASDQIKSGGTLIGYNILEFDLPFLMFRAIVNKITIPLSLGKWYRGRFQAYDAFIDLQVMALFGKYSHVGFKLDRVARALGLPGKNGDGAAFYKMPPEQARAYLENDINITKLMAERFGLA